MTTERPRLVLQPPPELDPHEGAAGVLMNAIPMLGSLGSIVLVTTMGGTSAGRGYLAGGMFLFATLGFVLVQIDRQRTVRVRRVTGSRTDYLRHLARSRATIRAAADRQRRAELERHPDPRALPSLAHGRTRLWAREAGGPGLLRVRYGVGDRPLDLELVPPDGARSARTDPAAALALDRLLAVHRVQRDLPLTVDLGGVERVGVHGPDDEEARSLARALVCSLAVAHAPDRVLVAVLCDPARRGHWDWVKWLPHTASPRRHDAVGARRLVATSPEELAQLLPDAGPHVVLVVDGTAAPTGPGRTVLEVVATGVEAHLVAGGERLPGHADRCDPATAEALARRLAPRRPGPDGPAEHRTAAAPDLPELLGLGDVRRLDPATGWAPRSDRDRLRVPIGRAEDGTVVHLDLKESAEQGMGPHGLVVGATGSGKSELLRTLVLGLTLTHSPADLNLVLVDFKGGATFAGLAGLPHVSAVITNLADELPLVDRMQDALAGELVRRQELLRAAGNLASVREHARARAVGAPLAPLPSLLVVVDEFSELLAAKPEFLDLFVAIGRLGRSLGLHLLLASQRLEEGRLRGLESHLSYRIGLRTFSASESRAVLGVPDAHELPSVPGLGYLRSGPTSLDRFSGAFVSGPPREQRSPEPGTPTILPFTVAEVARLDPPGPAPRPAPPQQDSLLDLAVGRMAGHGPAAHRVWLPPLDRSPTLGALLRGRRDGPGLMIPVGVVDRPRQQRRDPLLVDLAGATGHVAVVGGPRSGKSTLLRTLVTGLALTTTPLETQVLVLDLGGGTFAPLAALPHVAGVGTRDEPAVVRRVVAEAHGVVDRREAFFRAHGIEAIETYRARRAEGRADDGWGDVVLVVDGWGTLRSDFPDLEAEIQRLAARGLAYGVHVVAGAARWADFRAAVRDLFGTRLELRLGDPIDSEVDRRAAALVPAGRPGRGLLAGGEHFLAALPVVDGVGDLPQRIAADWTGPTGPRLRLLPERIGLDRVRDLAGGTTERRLLLGVDERDLAPVALDPDDEPHLLVLGEGRSGKSALLRTYVHEVLRTRTPREAQLVLVDYRRSLLGEVPDEHLLHHLTSSVQAGPALTELASYLAGRLPGPDDTPDQLRRRGWWTGAEVFVVVDDLDLVTTSPSSPLAVLQPLLAQARDVGLHLVVARRSGGASRALHEPVLQTLRDLAAPGLLLAGSPEEGPLVGGLRPEPGPPGRGRLVTRDRGVEVVQTAWAEPI